MAKNNSDATNKMEKHRKKLAKRLKQDLSELLELSLVSGEMSPESLGDLLKGLGETLSKTQKVHGKSEHLRKAGRFLENLHKEHKKVIKQGQLAREEHDQKQLLRVKKMAKKGMKPAQIARILRKEGERVTAEAIRRILKNKE